MAPIRTRHQLATLLERQMAAASAQRAPDRGDELDARTALKTYLLEAHDALRKDPATALGDLAARAGLSVEATDEPELFALTQGDLAFWLDTTGGRFAKLYTTASAKDADRVHEALVSAGTVLEPVWLLPSQLEALAEALGGRTVLFSLRHDRRPLRRDPAADEGDGVDVVTLRFWAPTALETLRKLRHSEVLPGATSVHSVRVRLDEPDAYAVAEVFHNGKLTAVGSSFAQHERIVRGALEAATSFGDDVAAAARAGRTVSLAVPWGTRDLTYAVLKMFGGAEPYRLWGLPTEVAPETFRVRAVDLGVGRVATFEVSRAGVDVLLEPGTPPSVLGRFIANLQYGVRADITAPLPLELAQAGTRDAPPAPRPLPFGERATLDQVARVVLPEACAQWLRGAMTLTAQAIAAGVLGGNAAAATPALLELCRQVLAEAAAYEWRERLKPVLTAEGGTHWRWVDPPPADGTLRTRDLVKLNNHARKLVARISGGVDAPWLQLSLFGPEELVPPVDEA